MASTSEVIHCYDQLATNLSRMLQLARAKSWDQLPELESQCSALVDRLKNIEPLESLNPQQRDDVRQLVVRIRHDQEAVCGLIVPQLERLVRKMDQLQNQNNLNRAYRPLS